MAHGLGPDGENGSPTSSTAGRPSHNWIQGRPEGIPADLLLRKERANESL